MFWFKKKKNFIRLVAVHISGQRYNYMLDLEEFNTTLEIERQSMDEFIENSRNVVTSNEISDRDLIAEFGHHRIKYNDFSSFSVEEVD